MIDLDIIDLVPANAGARLEADAFFSDIVVVVADDGNVAEDIKRKQAVITRKSGKAGAAVVVLPIEADDDQSNLKFGPMTLRLSFQVYEQREINRGASGTGKSGRRIARQIRNLIKSAVFEGIAGAMIPDNPCIQDINIEEGSGKIVRGHQVNFRCLEANTGTPLQVAAPAFEIVEGALVLSCTTAGASIYYTTGDGYPSQQEGATLYNAPVPVPPIGFTVRACAYAPGQVASIIARKTITAT